MRKNLSQRHQEQGGTFLWVLAACALIAIAYYFIQKKTPPPTVAPVAEATPPPAQSTPPPIVQATPAPVATPQPVAVTTPPPTPAATPPLLELDTVARNPALLPQQVALLQPKMFPITLNGRIAGQAQAPVGTMLRVMRVVGQQVEVEYQNGRHLVPAASTDLMQRALATFKSSGGSLPSSGLPSVATTRPAEPMNAPSATPPPNSAIRNAATISDRLGAEVVRMKKTRIQGGDWDDKTDRITLKVKLWNSDNTKSADKLKGEIYIFAESILMRNAVKLLATETFDFSLPARGSHEFTTGEVSTRYDTTVGRFGHRYEGWLLRVRDSAGKVVLEKATSPGYVKNAERIAQLATGRDFDRGTLKR